MLSILAGGVSLRPMSQPTSRLSSYFSSAHTRSMVNLFTPKHQMSSKTRDRSVIHIDVRSIATIQQGCTARPAMRTFHRRGLVGDGSKRQMLRCPTAQISQKNGRLHSNLEEAQRSSHSRTRSSSTSAGTLGGKGFINSAVRGS